jgi:hypothetical protein
LPLFPIFFWRMDPARHPTSRCSSVYVRVQNRSKIPQKISDSLPFCHRFCPYKYPTISSAYPSFETLKIAPPGSRIFHRRRAIDDARSSKLEADL